MARNRRRAARTNVPKPTATHSASSTRSNTPVQVKEPEAENLTAETCPACDLSKETTTAVDKESWIRCDACKTWYHWRCVGDDSDVESIDKW